MTESICCNNVVGIWSLFKVVQHVVATNFALKITGNKRLHAGYHLPKQSTSHPLVTSQSEQQQILVLQQEKLRLLQKKWSGDACMMYDTMTRSQTCFDVVLALTSSYWADHQTIKYQLNILISNNLTLLISLFEIIWWTFMFVATHGSVQLCTSVSVPNL